MPLALGGFALAGALPAREVSGLASLMSAHGGFMPNGGGIANHRLGLGDPGNRCDQQPAPWAGDAAVDDRSCVTWKARSQNVCARALRQLGSRCMLFTQAKRFSLEGLYPKNDA